MMTVPRAMMMIMMMVFMLFMGFRYANSVVVPADGSGPSHQQYVKLTATTAAAAAPLPEDAEKTLLKYQYGYSINHDRDVDDGGGGRVDGGGESERRNAAESSESSRRNRHHSLYGRFYVHGAAEHAHKYPQYLVDEQYRYSPYNGQYATNIYNGPQSRSNSHFILGSTGSGSMGSQPRQKISKYKALGRTTKLYRQSKLLRTDATKSPSSKPQPSAADRSAVIDEDAESSYLSEPSFGAFGYKLNYQAVPHAATPTNYVTPNYNTPTDASQQPSASYTTSSSSSSSTTSKPPPSPPFFYSSSTAKTIASDYISSISMDKQLLFSTERSFSEQPIIVDDAESSQSNHTNENNSKSRYPYDVTEPSALLVTPRPIGSNFLAPITAGVQLQSVESPSPIENAEDTPQHEQNYLIEVQKSLPYYLGKLEYVKHQQSSKDEDDDPLGNFELGKSFFNFGPTKSTSTGSSEASGGTTAAHHTHQQLPHPDQLPKFVHRTNEKHQISAEKPTATTHLLPVDFTRYISGVYPVPPLVSSSAIRPFDVVKNAAPIFHHFEPLKVPVFLPQPYVLPYQAAPPAPKPVFTLGRVPPSPSTSSSPLRFATLFFNHHHHPHPHSHVVPALQHSSIQHQQPSQYQFSIINPPSVYAHSQYFSNVGGSAGGGYPAATKLGKSIQYFSRDNQHQQRHQQQQQQQQHQQQQLPNCDQSGSGTNHKHNYAFKTNHYGSIGGMVPPPPKKTASTANATAARNLNRKFRNARSNFNSNLRLEYGFMPPLIPSQEIDENGKPIFKSDE